MPHVTDAVAQKGASVLHTRMSSCGWSKLESMGSERTDLKATSYLNATLDQEGPAQHGGVCMVWIHCCGIMPAASPRQLRVALALFCFVLAVSNSIRCTPLAWGYFACKTR
jgi:hypothetical protein